MADLEGEFRGDHAVGPAADAIGPEIFSHVDLRRDTTIVDQRPYQFRWSSGELSLLTVNSRCRRQFPRHIAKERAPEGALLMAVFDERPAITPAAEAPGRRRSPSATRLAPADGTDEPSGRGSGARRRRRGSGGWPLRRPLDLVAGQGLVFEQPLASASRSSFFSARMRRASSRPVSTRRRTSASIFWAVDSETVCCRPIDMPRKTSSLFSP